MTATINGGTPAPFVPFSLNVTFETPEEATACVALTM
jgi:hypothetical protein